MSQHLFFPLVLPMGLLCHFQVMHYVSKWLVNIFPDIPTPQSPCGVANFRSAAQWRWAHCDHQGGRCWNQPSLAWLNLSWAKSMKNMGKKTRQDIDLGISYLSFCENRRMEFMVNSWQWWGCYKYIIYIYIYIWYGIKTTVGVVNPKPQKNRDSFYTPPISGHWGWFIVLGLPCQAWWVQLWVALTDDICWDRLCRLAGFMRKYLDLLVTKVQNDTSWYTYLYTYMCIYIYI